MSRRSNALRRHCGLCGAAPGQPCAGVNGPRKAVHQQRFKGEMGAPLRVVARNGPAEDLSVRTARMLQEAAEMVAVRWEESFEHSASKCESPIERHLLLGLMDANETAIERFEFSNRKIDFETYEPLAVYETECDALVFTQIDIGPYRVDFLIYDQSRVNQYRWMAVECDGHQFHERTKEQARRDKQRDRYLTRRNVRVLRFTGSEIYADVEVCAQEIIDNLIVNTETLS